MRKPDATARDLFASDAAAVTNVLQRVFVLTNRNNILDFLSGGMITPAAGISKYYVDVSATAAGRVPVFGSRVPYSQSLEETPSSFPVAIELDLAKLSATPIPSFSEGEVPSNTPVGIAGILAWAPAGVIPTSAALAIHFRSDVEKSEYQAREFANIPNIPVRLSVDRELFSNEDHFVNTILRWLRSLPDPQPQMGAQLRTLDREAGALALVAHVIRGTAEHLGDFGQLITADLNASPGANRGSKRPKRQKRAVATTSAVSKHGLPIWLTAQLSGKEIPTAETTEAIVFGAAAEVFQNVDVREAWRPLEQLDAIEDSALAKLLNDEAKAEVNRNIEAVRAVVRLDRDFRPLNTGKGLESAKAMLMVLLRPEPTNLLAWDRAESGASDDVLAGAAYLSGMLNGHKRLPVSLRFENLDLLLAERTAGRLALPETLWSGPAKRDVQVRGSSEASEGGDLTLYVNDIAILTKGRPPSSLAERLLRLDASKPETEALLIDVASSLDWSHCLESVVQFTGDQISVYHNKKSKSIDVTGPGVATTSVRLRVVAWRKKLEEEGIPSSQERAISELLAKVRPQGPDGRDFAISKGNPSP
jgi:hypothetical protein